MPLAAALAPLGVYQQFVIARIDPKFVKGANDIVVAHPWKTNKVSLDPRSLFNGNAHDPANWLDAATAFAMVEKMGPRYVVGFVITAADPFWCLDADDALQADGTWSPVAQQLVAALPGACVELSFSRRGLHIWGSGPVPPHGKKNEQWGVELYSEARFIALGPDGNAYGSPLTDHSAMLGHIVNGYFPPIETTGPDAGWTTEPSADWNGPTDDDDLIRRALQSSSTRAMFGNGASFRDLWEGHTEALGRAYPDASRPYDASSADAALAQHLAFWTGRDCARIERLMRQSALVRPKWDREDYLTTRTIQGACGRQREVISDKAAVERPGPQSDVSAPRPQPLVGNTFLHGDAQADLFAGCVYVSSEHRALIPGGTLMKPEAFKAHFGGYTFAMDQRNERTSRNAWEALTESQIARCPRADSTCFRPDLPAATLVQDSGRVLVNTWWPVDVPRQVGDPTPFLVHLRKLLPDERDQTILLSYMAACVQHKGIKFQWAPLLQGVEGNGKTLLSRCVAEAIGARYVHWPKASKIAKQFNAWMDGKLFYGVEDIHINDGQTDVIEELKPMITGGDGLEIEAKGVDQVSRRICGNFIFNSNHKSGLRKTKNDRRFAVFYTAQQDERDLARDGMTEAYFVPLYRWLQTGGYAIVTELLSTYPIPPEFDPAVNCVRAPKTSTTDEAIAHGLGRVEQEILEAVDQGMPGFCGGWISSIQVDHLLTRINRAGAIPPNRRRETMQSLGYDWHPGLREGRVNNIIMPDNGKPKLFVLDTRLDLRALQGADIARTYTAAQQVDATVK